MTSSVYPGAFDSDANLPRVIDSTAIIPAHPNNLNDAIQAIEGAVGLTPSDWPLVGGAPQTIYDAVEALIDAGSGGGSAYALQASVVVSSPQAAMTFASIPGTGHKLAIDWVGRASSATGYQAVKCNFNADTGANYDYLEWLSAGGGRTATLAGFSYAGYTFGTNGTAGMAGQGRLEVPEYAATNFFKGIQGSSNLWVGSGAIQIEEIFGQWRSTSAITQVSLTLEDGSNWVVGSTARLYIVT